MNATAVNLADLARAIACRLPRETDWDASAAPDGYFEAFGPRISADFRLQYHDESGVTALYRVRYRRDYVAEDLVWEALEGEASLIADMVRAVAQKMDHIRDELAYSIRAGAK